MKVITLSSEAGHSKVNCFSRRKESNKVIGDWYDFTVFGDMESLMRLSISQVKVSKTPLELEQALNPHGVEKRLEFGPLFARN